MMATLRNLAISVLRLAGAVNIAAGLRSPRAQPGASVAGPVLERRLCTSMSISRLRRSPCQPAQPA